MRFNRLIWIPKTDEFKFLLAKIKSEMLVVSRFSDYSKDKESPDHFPVFCENETEIGVPPEYMRKNFSTIFHSLRDETPIGDDIVPPLVFKGTLEAKLRQFEAVQAVQNKRSFQKSIWSNKRKNRSKILSLQCGGGKTVISLYLLAQLNKKALVVVPTKTLQFQWKSRIETFLPTCRVGLLNGKKVGFKVKWTFLFFSSTPKKM